MDKTFTNFNTDQLTLNDWFEIYLQDYKSPKVKKTTLQNYISLYDNHLRNSLGPYLLFQIKPIHIQQLYNHFILSGHSSASLQTFHSLLYNIFDMAMRNDYLTKNPCIATLRPHAEHKERQILTAEEQTFLLNFIRQEKWHFYEPMITTMLGTGIRIGELLGLQWNDIDFTRKTISVNRTLVYIRNKQNGHFNFEMQSPKTKYSKRTIPMLPNVESALTRQCINQRQLQKSTVWNPLPNFESLVFTGRKGQPLLTASVQNVLNRIALAIKEDVPTFKHLHPHMMRHSFATRCFEADIPPKTVQVILGHSNIQITLDLYTHVSEEKKWQDIQKINHLL